MKQIREIMIDKVKLVHPDTKLNQVAQEMKNFNIGVVPVVDGDHVVGMLSDRDIVIRAVAEGKDVKQMTVREIMSEGVNTIYEDQSTDDLANVMKDEKIRRVVVLDHDEHVAGIVSLGDVATYLGGNLSGDILSNIASSSPKKPEKTEEK